jgi:hypothetical protein
MTQSGREFLKSCGGLIVSFSAGSLSLLSAQGQGQFGTRPSHIDPEKLDSWLAIGRWDHHSIYRKMRFRSGHFYRSIPAGRGGAVRSNWSRQTYPLRYICLSGSQNHVWKSIDSDKL